MRNGRERGVAVIAGAGPAGLTAALELLRWSDITPVVFEADAQVGGLSKTIRYRGNRMDLGGHRFFSKSDWVMRWWQDILPVAVGEAENGPLWIAYQGRSRALSNKIEAAPDAHEVLLVRQRLSRIFYRRRFFDYPLKINGHTIRALGFFDTASIAASYARAQLFSRFPERSLEDFLVNRFGERLYRTFFKDYTEKVWGVPCRDISADWGAQRIKGLSVAKALVHAIRSRLPSSPEIRQKRVETSLIERFLYPRLGPGQMWEEVARRVEAGSGSIHLRQRIVGIEHQDGAVSAVQVRDESGSIRRVACDHLISSMPVSDLVRQLKPPQAAIRRIADGLPYRDFITAGLLVRSMRTSAEARRGAPAANGMPPDNWIYIQEPDVRIGRLQIFNNWSPSMVADPSTIWLGLEYFCQQGDDLWCMEDGSFIDFAAGELAKIGLIERREVLDGTVVRVPKAYPAYFGEYREFAQVRAYLDQFRNLYPIGRNGMHRYNNQDHSMLAARAAVNSILDGGRGKSEIWRINEESAYQEELSEQAGGAVSKPVTNSVSE
jgi:protoporphyrinogen oxidase